MTNIEPIVYVNGNWQPLSAASVPVFDLGLWGLAATEMLRTWSGRPTLADRHVNRLLRSATAIGVNTDAAHVPERDELVDIIHEAVERNSPLLTGGADLGISIGLSAGVNTSMMPEADYSGTLSVIPFVLRPETWQHKLQNGQHLLTSSNVAVPSVAMPASIKSRSRLHWRLAERDVKQRSADAVPLLLDEDGFVTETSTSNVFVVRDNKLLTVAADVLGGITASVVCEIAIAEALSIERVDLRPADLANADEAFTTSSVIGICPVSRYDDQPIGNACPGPMTSRLTQAFHQFVCQSP
ncbi:aminotransferase class IV [bacterium]|nr:aminotransferase class IV [bacterium]